MTDARTRWVAFILFTAAALLIGWSLEALQVLP